MESNKHIYALGLDFGTESARALLINAVNGAIIASSVENYPDGVIDTILPSGRDLGPGWALQNPSDWLHSTETTIKKVIIDSGIDPREICGIGIDFTSCTVLPVKMDGVPLCQLSGWVNEPNAWPKLWKHHAAQGQADRITQLAKERGEGWLKRYGGIISSEWMLPKALQILYEDPKIYAETELIVEAGDWLAWQLTGQLLRNACAAGFKGLWHKIDGYPSDEYLAELHPDFKDYYRTKGKGRVAPPGEIVGELTPEWAECLGLDAHTKVAVGIIDAHAGAIGAGVSQSEVLYMAMGTSTCHMLLANNEVFCEGISGVVEDGILPGWFGYEAGQAGVGDIFNWFTKFNDIDHETLTRKALDLPPGAEGLLALDWWNGCRTPLVDADLSGLILGCTLQTRPEAVYRALIEATAYGTRLIIDTFNQGGIPVGKIIAGGGLTKNELLLKIYADVTGLPFEVCSTQQASALGAAILGAVAGGVYPDMGSAVRTLAPSPRAIIQPDYENHQKYSELYRLYLGLVEIFGSDENSIMKQLHSLR
jgi:L-ribulokinase